MKLPLLMDKMPRCAVSTPIFGEKKTTDPSGSCDPHGGSHLRYGDKWQEGDVICCQVLRLGREVMARPGQESRSILMSTPD